MHFLVKNQFSEILKFLRIVWSDLVGVIGFLEAVDMDELRSFSFIPKSENTIPFCLLTCIKWLSVLKILFSLLLSGRLRQVWLYSL